VVDRSDPPLGIQGDQAEGQVVDRAAVSDLPLPQLVRLLPGPLQAVLQVAHPAAQAFLLIGGGLSVQGVLQFRVRF